MRWQLMRCTADNLPVQPLTRATCCPLCSGHLRLTRFGANINTFDVVMRTNQAPTKVGLRPIAPPALHFVAFYCRGGFWVVVTDWRIGAGRAMPSSLAQRQPFG
jgi:hypothetical protein